ncbi:MAG: hypothetical protein DRJ43_05015 [Thermoprotei archaeon]|nr:MAG: hypothetical protein DRJ43_05015 [Thermoprotei archaeon]
MLNEDVLRLLLMNVAPLPAEIVTYLGVKKYGIQHESNEATREMFRRLGVIPTFVLFHVALTGFTAFLLWLRKINWLTRIIGEAGYFVTLGMYSVDSLIDTFNWVRWEVLK